MYLKIAVLSAVVRQFFLPNPYVPFFSNEAYALIFNMFIGSLILHLLSFSLTGIYYNRGDFPSFGSLSYLFWYCVNTFIIIWIGTNIKYASLFIFSLILIYALLHYAVYSWTSRYN